MADKTLQQQIDEQRRAEDQSHEEQRRLDERAERDRAHAEQRHSDDMRLADIWASGDPEAREIVAKIGLALDERERAAGWDVEAREVPAHDPEPDPGWLARWEREGALSALTPQERAKLQEIDREDPYGRGQREQFLPREVLAIREKSDRMVEAREQERHQQHDEAGGYKQEPAAQGRGRHPDFEQEDELER